MTSILVAFYIFAIFGYLAAASRQLWAFARDNGVPFSSTIAKVCCCRDCQVISLAVQTDRWQVDQRYKIPLWAVGFTALFNALLALINIGSTAAFNAVVSLVVAGLSSSYLISISLLIRWRLSKEHIPFGPWSLGSWGLTVNIIAIFYTIITFVFSFFPPSTPVTPVSMNWSVVVYIAVLVFGLLFWALGGRKQYHGPVINSQFARRFEGDAR